MRSGMSPTRLGGSRMAGDVSRYDADPEFGDLVYEKDLSLTPTGLLVRGLIAGLLSVLGAFGAVVGREEGKVGVVLIGLALALAAPAAWYFLAYRDRVSRFRFFRGGVE